MENGYSCRNQSINQSNICLLTRRITRLTPTQAGFTEEQGRPVRALGDA